MTPPGLLPDELYDYEERLAILVIDGHVPEPEAERRAREEIIRRRPRQEMLF